MGGGGDGDDHDDGDDYDHDHDDSKDVEGKKRGISGNERVGALSGIIYSSSVWEYRGKGRCWDDRK
jgi:hypothetical protein